MTFVQRWYWFWFHIGFWLYAPANHLQRWFNGEHKSLRRPLPNLQTPDELLRYLQTRFVWRADRFMQDSRTGARGLFPLDYVSHPEVFQAHLEDTAVRGDGDCDDVALWAATMLLGMVSVDEAYCVATGYKGGGHVVPVYRSGEQWYWINYDVRFAVDDPAEVPQRVVERRGFDAPKFVAWWTALPKPFRKVAVGPGSSPA